MWTMLMLNDSIYLFQSLPIVGHFYESRTIDISKEDVEIILCQDSPYMFKFTEPVRTRLEELCKLLKNNT